MKRLTLILFVVVFSFLHSCRKDDDPQATNNSINGTWRVSENSTTFGQQNYIVEIINDTASANKIIIDNFFNLGINHQIIANISGSTININNAVLDGYTINGTGNIASNYNSISWNYNVDDGNGSEAVTSTYTRY